MRDLLLAVVAIAIGSLSVSWGGDPAALPADDPKAIAALEKAGVQVQRDPQGRVQWLDIVQGKFQDADMAWLDGLPALEWLQIAKRR